MDKAWKEEEDTLKEEETKEVLESVLDKTEHALEVVKDASSPL
jgi:hypothetical protein